MSHRAINATTHLAAVGDFPAATCADSKAAEVDATDSSQNTGNQAAVSSDFLHR
ncbi:MAG: hypothetical protein KDB23_15195 [Planctomycetales bacterium]|nr:hypothetical protein [Planctomycetales bacterium]